MAWSGNASALITSTDLIAAADLTTFRLDSTDSTRIAQAITAASGLIEAYCGRTFASTAYTEWIKAQGQYLQCEEYPLADGTPVVVRAPMNAITITLGTATTQYNSIIVDDTKLHLTTGGSTTSLTLASYATMALLVAALSSPWSGAVVYEDVPATLKPCAYGVTSGGVTTLECAGELVGYTVDHDSGLIDLGARSAGWYYTAYTAGYSTLPAAIKQVAIQLTADLCASGAANPLLAKESLGDYSYELRQGGMTFLAPYVDQLQPYVRVSL